MTTIASTEQFATGRYVNYGSPSALDDMATLTVCAYVKKTGAGGANLGYEATKYTPANGGWRLLLEDNGGSPRLVFGWDSDGTANNPSRTGTGGEVVNNSWQHHFATATRSLNASDINLYVGNTECTYSNSTSGTGSLRSDASQDLFIGNRGPSGTLGRELAGDMAFFAIWNRILDSTARGRVITYGPWAEPSGLVFLFANDQDYSANAFTQTARSTRVTGSTPTNTLLGDQVIFNGTVPGQSHTQNIAGFSLDLSTYFSGLRTPFSYAVQAGTLPTGLSLNTSTGVISGTPTVVQTQSGIVIRATDSQSSTADTNSFQIQINAPSGGSGVVSKAIQQGA